MSLRGGKMIRVLHLDNDIHHQAFIKTKLLNITSDIELERVSSIDEAKPLLNSGDYNCVLTDDQQPNNAGVGLLHQSREKGDLIPFVILSDMFETKKDFILGAYADDEFNVAVEFLRFDLICRLINQLVAKHKEVLQKQGLISNLFDGSPELSEKVGLAEGSLTKREKEILTLIASGKSNKEIATDLGISYWTVINHVHNLFVKLGLHSRAEAIRIALGMKLTDRG